MKCPKCNEEISSKAKFCTKCGANVEEEKKKIEEIKKQEEAEKVEEVKEDTKKKEEVVNDDVEEKNNKVDNSENEEQVNRKNKEAKFSKKEPKPKKKHTGIKVIFILIIVLAILIAGTYGLYKIDALPESVDEFVTPIFEKVEEWFGNRDTEEKEESKNESKNMITNETKEEKVNKLDKNKGLVYDYYTARVNGVTSKIPQINLDCDNVKRINEEIKSELEDKVKELENSKGENTQSMGLVGVNYKWYENDKILSLVIAKSYGTGVNEYLVYNINTDTGKDVDNTELLKEVDFKEDDFISRAQSAVEATFDSMFDKNDSIITSATGYSSARSKTIDKSNFSIKKMDMFLNANGKISIIANINTLAGAGYTYKIVVVDEEFYPVKEDSSTVNNKTTTNSTSNTVKNTTNTNSNSTTETGNKY